MLERSPSGILRQKSIPGLIGSMGLSIGSSVKAIILFNSAATTSATDITVTATSSGNISGGVYGVEYKINSAPPPYTFSLNTPGATSSQTVNINLATEGINPGDTVYIRAYYNLNPLDPADARVYGTPTLTVTITAQFMLPGVGYINTVGSGQYMLPGYGYINL